MTPACCSPWRCSCCRRRACRAGRSSAATRRPNMRWIRRACSGRGRGCARSCGLRFLRPRPGMPAVGVMRYLYDCRASTIRSEASDIYDARGRASSARCRRRPTSCGTCRSARPRPTRRSATISARGDGDEHDIGAGRFPPGAADGAGADTELAAVSRGARHRLHPLSRLGRRAARGRPGERADASGQRQPDRRRHQIHVDAAPDRLPQSHEPAARSLCLWRERRLSQRGQLWHCRADAPGRGARQR